MSLFWEENRSMAEECRRIMESIRGRQGSRTVAGTSDGRLWVSCVSCMENAVLGCSGWLGKGRNQAMLEKNGFVFSVCGECERKDRTGLGTGASTRIHRDTIRSSPAFSAIARHCEKSEWDGLEIQSERLIDRGTLVGQRLRGMTMRSVKVWKVDEGWAVRVLDHVEGGFLG